MSDLTEAADAAEPETVWIGVNVTLKRQRDGSYEGVMSVDGVTTGIRAWRNKTAPGGEFSLIQFQQVRAPRDVGA